MTIGGYLIERLAAHGVGHVFGIPGDYVLGFYEQLQQSPLQTITTGDEQGAGFAADAYARVRGLGAVCVTYCVGGLKVVNPIAGTFAEKSPVVVISGAPGMNERERTPLLQHKVREFDTHRRVFAEITVANAALEDPDPACAEIDRVLHAALRYKRPVYLELPRDIIGQPGRRGHRAREVHEKSGPLVLTEALAEAAAMINAAQHTASYCLLDVHLDPLDKSAALGRLAERKAKNIRENVPQEPTPWTPPATRLRGSPSSLDSRPLRGDAQPHPPMKPLPFLLRALAASALLFSPTLRADDKAPAGALTFVRASETADRKTSAQTLCAEFRPADGKGPSIWLIGVAHFGTAEYYRAIQQRLDRHSVVLYEGIGMEDVKAGPGQAGREAGIQAGLAKALGLVFQLDAIDYRRPHFINSDIKAETIAGQIKEKGAAAGGGKNDPTFGMLLDALRGSGDLGAMLNVFVSTLGKSPEMQETTKVLLIEVLGRSDELMGLAQSASPAMKDLLTVLLAERNAVVFADLRRQLAQRQAGESVAIFYGAAHMPELAQRLRDELRYVPAVQEWETAFTADPAKGGINPAQIRLLLELAKTQLKAAQPAGK